MSIKITIVINTKHTKQLLILYSFWNLMLKIQTNPIKWNNKYQISHFIQLNNIETI